MASDKKQAVEKIKRQMTFVVEYEHEEGCYIDEPLQILVCVSEALKSWNSNRSANAYNRCSISGFWLEPDDVPIEQQNELIDDINDKQ